MRKILLAILAVILCLISAYMLYNKLNIGNLEILGIKLLIEKNDELDSKIVSANNAYTNVYNVSMEKLEAASENLKKEKQEYDDYIMEVSTNSSLANQIQTYEIEYLWTKIGNYASNEDVVLKMEVVSNNSSINTYDLNFTATGKYISITEFIYKLENDSSLLFKIEGFKLVPDSVDGSKLKATFVCKDVSINVDSATSNRSVTPTITEATSVENTDTEETSSSATSTKSNSANSIDNSNNDNGE